MKLKVLNHPLIDFYMTMLRSKDTQSSKFRFLAKKVTSLMAFEIFKDLKVLPKTIETPLDKHNGVTLNNQKPCIISILRAGLIIISFLSFFFFSFSFVPIFPSFSLLYSIHSHLSYALFCF
jgi:uracil phosphoribosyltransferase